MNETVKKWYDTIWGRRFPVSYPVYFLDLPKSLQSGFQILENPPNQFYPIDWPLLSNDWNGFTIYETTKMKLDTPNDIVDFYFKSKEFNADFWEREWELQELRSMGGAACFSTSYMRREEELESTIKSFKKNRMEKCLKQIENFLILERYKEYPKSPRVTIEHSGNFDMIIESDKVNFDPDNRRITFGVDVRATIKEKYSGKRSEPFNEPLGSHKIETVNFGKEKSLLSRVKELIQRARETAQFADEIRQEIEK